MFSIGAFGIIFDETGRVLLCHRYDQDVWNLPGGRVDSGELPTDAVLREVLEESGLEVEVGRLVGVYGKINKDELDFSFICQATSQPYPGMAEDYQSQYFDLDKLPPNTNPKHVERIHDAVLPEQAPLFYRQTAPSTQEMLKDLRNKNK